MSIEISKKIGEKAWYKCLKCRGMTKHSVHASVSHNGFIDGPDMSFQDEYKTAQCDGCETFCFLKESSNSEESDNDGSPLISVQRFPETEPEFHAGAAYITDEVYSMPGIVQSIYTETLGAIRRGLPILAGIGIRAIVEATCDDQKASGKSLEKKIDDLVSKSLLTQKGADILHGIRVIGNIAAHDIIPPTEEQVAAAMKVIDHLLIGAYVIPNVAKVLPVPSKKTSSTAGPTATNSPTGQSVKKTKSPGTKGGGT